MDHPDLVAPPSPLEKKGFLCCDTCFTLVNSSEI